RRGRLEAVRAEERDERALVERGEVGFVRGLAGADVGLEAEGSFAEIALDDEAITAARRGQVRVRRRRAARDRERGERRKEDSRLERHRASATLAERPGRGEFSSRARKQVTASWPGGSSVRYDERMRAVVLPLAVLAAAAGCSGAPEPLAFQNKTFYQ